MNLSIKLTDRCDRQSVDHLARVTTNIYNDNVQRERRDGKSCDSWAYHSIYLRCRRSSTTSRTAVPCWLFSQGLIEYNLLDVTNSVSLGDWFGNRAVHCLSEGLCSLPRWRNVVYVRRRLMDRRHNRAGTSTRTLAMCKCDRNNDWSCDARGTGEKSTEYANSLSSCLVQFGKARHVASLYDKCPHAPSGALLRSANLGNIRQCSDRSA